MGKQIIKQPNGKYCIFSGIVDNVTHYNMSEEEIVQLWSNDSNEHIAEFVKEKIEKIERGEKPYNQFTMSYHDMLTLIGDVHGGSEFHEVKNLIES